MKMQNIHMQEMYPVSRTILGAQQWQALLDILPGGFKADQFPDILANSLDRVGLPAYLPDLARVEALLHAVLRPNTFNFHTDTLCVNPTLTIAQVAWTNLAEIIQQKGQLRHEPEHEEKYLLVWRSPGKDEPSVQYASSDELLALKIVVENLDKPAIARLQETSLAALDGAIERAVSKGILLRPSSLLNRNTALFAADIPIPEKYTAAKVFTLQWHITQTCDLRCKHCYDRSSREAVSLEEAAAVLDQLYDFCQERHVYGQVSFSGGNPLLHPHFFDIYQAAADRGFMTAILGNPTTPEILAKIIAIQKPEFFQVSLEGLQEHNDFIRGEGFFNRVVHFLDVLRAAGIYSMVMLTLTRDNMDQVLPLGELLRDKVDLFTFNRLSAVGEGAQLMTPGKQEYEAFLRTYLEAKELNPVMGLKDNLINIISLEENRDVFGGCAGFGCGAAFNFVAVLPDGEVHACRKFTSPIGTLKSQSLSAIYDSAQAERYRSGPSSCRGCRVRHVCGSCLAVIDSQGLDLTVDCDPCCFLEKK